MKRLGRINDWPERARHANWCVATLAKNCGVSPSSLERHFQETLGECPREWLNVERMRQACELLCDHTSAKEAAILLGYRNQHHFSHAFKKLHGYPPSLHSKKLEDRELKMAKDGGLLAAPTCRAETSAGGS